MLVLSPLTPNLKKISSVHAVFLAVLFAGQVFVFSEEGLSQRAEFESILALAQKGDAASQLKMGQLYESGIGVTKDEQVAFSWYEKAAQQGNKTAQTKTGYAYLAGIGVSPSPNSAIGWFRKAAEQGDAEGQNYLGYCYLNGEGIEKNEGEAFSWFKKSAEQGSSWGQVNLGVCYREGRGTLKNEAEAFKWISKAADSNDVQAVYMTGAMYVNGIGVDKNEERGFQLIFKAAEKNHPEAQYNLGVCYMGGLGVKKNEDEALKWFEKAAQQGNVGGLIILGDMYNSGEGAAKNPSRAFKFYKEAADKGSSEAKRKLVEYFPDGVETSKITKEPIQTASPFWVLSDALKTCKAGFQQTFKSAAEVSIHPQAKPIADTLFGQKGAQLIWSILLFGVILFGAAKNIRLLWGKAVPWPTKVSVSYINFVFLSSLYFGISNTFSNLEGTQNPSYIEVLTHALAIIVIGGYYFLFFNQSAGGSRVLLFFGLLWAALVIAVIAFVLIKHGVRSIPVNISVEAIIGFSLLALFGLVGSLWKGSGEFRKRARQKKTETGLPKYLIYSCVVVLGAFLVVIGKDLLTFPKLASLALIGLPVVFGPIYWALRWGDRLALRGYQTALAFYAIFQIFNLFCIIGPGSAWVSVGQTILSLVVCLIPLALTFHPSVREWARKLRPIL